MTLILDTGALIAVESSDREVLSLLQEAFLNHEEVHVPAGVIAQAWRNRSGKFY